MNDVPEHEDASGEAPEPSAVDAERVQARAYELSLERPDATPEENWLLAEEQLREQEAKERALEAQAREDEANLMARIEMDVLGHP